MNEHPQDFTRRYIKDSLDKLHEKHHKLFKLAYARDNGKRSVEDALAMRIDDVVDAIPQEKLDLVVRQIERTLAEIKEPSK